MSTPTTPAKHPPANLKLAYTLGLLGVIAFGATLPITRIALEGYSPGFITFSRALIAALFGFALLRYMKKPLRHHEDFLIFIAGVLLIYAFPGFMSIAMQTVPASHGGVVLGFLPLTTALFARLLTDETPSPAFWLLSVLGCVIVATYTAIKSDDLGNSGISSGDSWLILAGLSASFGYVMFGKLSRNTQGWEIISRSVVLNLPLTFLGTWWFYDPAFADPQIRPLLALIYLGAFSMFLAFCAWNVALAIGGIARIGQMQLLQTFVTLAVAAVLLGEKLDIYTLGTAVAITSIIALTRKY